MQTLRLTQENSNLLFFLSEHPEGLYCKSLAKYLNANYFSTYQRLLRLRKHFIVLEEGTLWKITDKGLAFLQSGLSRSAVSHEALPTQSLKPGKEGSEAARYTKGAVPSRSVLPSPEGLTSPASAVPSRTIPPKRLNGCQLTFRPLRTEYSRLEALLAEAGLHYRKVKVKHHIQYELAWMGYNLKLTTRKLIAYAPMAYARFEIEGKVLLNDEINKAMNSVGSFVKQLKLKMIADKESGRLWVKVSYFEIAHTESTIGEKITKKRKQSFAPLAYDLNTLKMVNWADRSLKLAEHEFNELSLEQKAANFMQDMNDGKYYHREEQEKLNEALSSINLLKETQLKSAEQILQLAQQLNLHAPYLTAWKEVADAIHEPEKRARARRAIEKLGQRKLI